MLSRRQLRHFWVQIHLWPGLVLGGFFALLGLTGSLLAFYPEIDLWLNPGQRVAVSAEPVRLQPVLAALRADRPDYTGAWRLELPLAPGRPVGARYARPPETAGRSFAPYLSTVDPLTGRVSSRRFWGDAGMTWLYDLHYTLLLQQPGRWLVGGIGLISLLSLATGLYLWWPSGRWRAALRPVLRPGRVRATFDLHVLSGAYGLVLLVILGVTGVVMAWPEVVQPVLARVSPMAPWPMPQSLPLPGSDGLDVDQAVARAQAVMPGAEVRWVETPAGPEGSYRVNLALPDDPGRRFPHSHVWIDAYSGAVLAVRDWRQASAAEVFLGWQHPLHNGEVFGLPGRIIACLAGLLPALLWVTGVLRWQQKRQARQRAQVR